MSINLQVARLACKHGELYLYAGDEFVGRSLDLLGEYSEDEVVMMQRILKPDSVVVEVGANIGAHSVPISRLCKKLIAIEAQPENFMLLQSNLAKNLCENVEIHAVAVKSQGQRAFVPALDKLGHCNFGRVEIGKGDVLIRARSLDDIVGGRRVDVIKIDAEGSELDVLKSAAETVAICRPIIYVENDRREGSTDLIAWLMDAQYRCYWHRPPLYNPKNWKGMPFNPWPGIHSINMVCFPEEMRAAVDGLEEVSDSRVDAQMYERALARALGHVCAGVDVVEERFKAAHYANLMGDEAYARGLIAQNLADDIGHVGTRALKGLLDLQAGNWRDGWPAYELRYQQKNAAGFGFRPHDAPHWSGMPTTGRVLIWAEQGFGDSIMFARFVAEAMRRAPNLILEVQPQLFELFELSGLVPKGQLYRLGRTMPAYDWHCSLPSLPATLGGYENPESVSCDAYLSADPKMIDSWLRRGDRPRIGVCCKGGAASERAYSRDIPIELIDPIAKKYGPFMSLENNGQWESYADTAAAILALDCVITVDTSVAHLAGALGAPTYLLLSSDPDWRWMRHFERTPWYPSMKIIRQSKFMEWGGVIDQLDFALTCRKNAA